MKSDRKNSTQKPSQVDRCSTEASTLIVIPVFNEVKYVDQVLSRVRRYSKNILVVDDGSKDGTSELLAKHTDINILSHKWKQ